MSPETHERKNGDNNVFEIGPIRPPSEGGSLLLRVTRGCTWNQCSFCDLYRSTPFKMLPMEEIKRAIDLMAYYRDRIYTHRNSEGRLVYQDILDDMESLDRDEQECYNMVLNWLAGGSRSVFLQDGNTVAMAPGKLAEVLRYLKETFPYVDRITSYGRAESLSKISVEEYKELKESGLTRIHSGFESGSDKVLKLINKGVTSDQEIEAGIKVKEGGIELSVYFMPGIGGKVLSGENAEETARVINAINPDFVRLRTAVIKPGTDLWKMQEKGEYVPCTDVEKMEEIRLLISKIENCDGYLASDHIINLLEGVSGSLDQDKEKMLDEIDEFLNLPKIEQRRFQLARRIGIASGVSDLLCLSKEDQASLERMITEVWEEEHFEERLNQWLRQYI